MKTEALEARVEAIELFLQQIVFLLEVEPSLTKENVTAWLVNCRSRQRQHQVTSAPVLAAFGNLIDRALGVTPGQLEPDATAIETAAAGLKKAGQNPPLKP